MGVRPPLPYRFANPYINDHMNAPQLPFVKYQILTSQGRDILVGRLKIDTPTESGHTFILRRYDTGAISLTTMFRAAFPNASADDEKTEIHWVKGNFDLSGNNGSPKDPHITRLAGTWIDPQLALELGKAYSLGPLVKIAVNATPDPNGNYRRSSKNTASASKPATSVLAPPLTSTTSTTVLASTTQSSTIIVSKTPSSTKTLPTPSPTSTNPPPPAKRRKDASLAPTPAATSSVKPASRVSTSPSVSKTSSVAPRRSNRNSKSPAPRTVAPLTSIRTPKRTIKKDQAVMTPSSSELAAVDEEDQIVENGVAGTELMEEDIKEQKRLITELKKKEEEEAAPPFQQAGETPMEESDHASTLSKKREREDEDQPLTFDFKEPEKVERAIATNSRIARFTLEPRTKSFAWGIAAFAVGMGAVTFLPSLF